MTINCFLTKKDCGDGTVTICLFKTRQECLDKLNRTEEQLEEGDTYNDGCIEEVSLEVEAINGVLCLKKGFNINIY